MPVQSGSVISHVAKTFPVETISVKRYVIRKVVALAQDLGIELARVGKQITTCHVLKMYRLAEILVENCWIVGYIHVHNAATLAIVDLAFN